MEFDFITFLTEYWQVFAALGGVAVFVPAIVGILKTFDVVKAGEGGKAQSIINMVLFAVFVGVKMFAPDADITGWDAILAQLTQILVSIGTILGQLGISKLSYDKLFKAKIPVLGKSYTHRF